MKNGTNGKLPLRVKLSYGAGDLYGGGATTLISMYYLYFLTDVLQISPALAGTAFLISKIWDAVTDPFMGIISDNTRTRFGRRRPYFLAGIFLIFISFALMWAPLPFRSEGIKFLYVLISYLFFSTVYTVVWVPYNSIAAELTKDYNERTKLSTYRMIFSNISGILAGTLAKDIFVDTLSPGDPGRGFFMMSIVFGLFFALPYIATFLYCKEDPEAMNAPRKRIESMKSFLTEYFVEPFRLKPFRSVMQMFLFGFMAQDAVLALAVYFLTYYLNMSSMMTLLVPVYLFMLLAIPLTEALSLRIGKRKTYIISCILWIFSFVLIPFMRSPEAAKSLIYVFGAFFGTAAAGISVMVFAMFPDVPDADELFSGVRREGIYSGIFAFLRKSGSALVMFLIGSGIQMAGYIPPTGTVQHAQTQGFLNFLLILFISLPVIFVLIALRACVKYPLTREVHQRLKAALALRHAEGETADALEENELKQILGDA
ncbi:MAG: MFS transporter [Spirochaetales bacterium]|nr:MFS transporter [Spirochaetales bacterium]